MPIRSPTISPGCNATSTGSRTPPSASAAPIIIPKIYNGRNKTFFYTAYERYRQNQTGRPGPNSTYPLKEFYDGDFSRLLIGGILGTKDALGRDVARGAIFDPHTFQQLPNGRYVADMFPGNRIPVSRISRFPRTSTRLEGSDTFRRS